MNETGRKETKMKERGFKVKKNVPAKVGAKKRKLTYKVHPEYDDAALSVFLEKQLQLFPEKVASTPEEAADFLEMCFAVIARSKREVVSYFEEAGTDVEGEDLFSASEVFPIGDGRYLIVEA